MRMGYKECSRRKIAKTRRIEASNSLYSSLGVRQQEDHDRWRDIDLFELPPLNRDEVEGLPVAVDVDGVKSLSPRDRLLLDNMILPRLST